MYRLVQELCFAIEHPAISKIKSNTTLMKSV
jgi:hypothetical protein